MSSSTRLLSGKSKAIFSCTCQNARLDRCLASIGALLPQAAARGCRGENAANFSCACRGAWSSWYLAYSSLIIEPCGLGLEAVQRSSAWPLGAKGQLFLAALTRVPRLFLFAAAWGKLWHSAEALDWRGLPHFTPGSIVGHPCCPCVMVPVGIGTEGPPVGNSTRGGFWPWAPLPSGCDIIGIVGHTPFLPNLGHWHWLLA